MHTKVFSIHIYYRYNLDDQLLNAATVGETGSALVAAATKEFSNLTDINIIT